MRTGVNPNKDNLKNVKYIHQVIVPVYIPNEEGYFKDSFQILKLCIGSLLNTVDQETYITIVNNGSSDKVIVYLNDLLNQNKIHEIIHTKNIGKINAVLKGMAGIETQIVTISDCDVLFKQGWQGETFSIFNAFPKAGVVGLVPMFQAFKFYSFNTIVDFLFSERMKFKKVKDPQSMIRFYDSIWSHKNYNQNYLKQILTLSSDDGTIAVVGSGHMVASFRRTIFNSFEKSYTNDLLSTLSDHFFLDLPPLNLGYYRLTTYDNYAYHMGNTYEKWMDELFPIESKNSVNVLNTSNNNKIDKSIILIKIKNYFKAIIVKKILFNSIVYKHFLKRKGLDDNYIKGF